MSGCFTDVLCNLCLPVTFSPAKICSSKILKKEEHPDCHTVLRFHVNYYTSEFDTYSTLHYGFWEEPKFAGANSH